MRSPLLFVAIFCLPAVCNAQAPPDAGSLRQQIERDRTIELPRRLAPEKRPEPAPMKADPGISVSVTEFRFGGNTLLSAERLAPAVAQYLNRRLGFSELEDAATAVANAYREAGWVARAYLPAQDITEGVVTIQIVEAVFGGAVLEGGAPTRLKLSYVLSRIEAQQPTGEALNADALDRALLIADDLPGVAVTGTLRSGEREDTTELVLKLSDEPLLIGEAGLDNTGSRATGLQRATAALTLNSPARVGDLASANLIETQGSEYARLAYSVPVGSKGLRLGANASAMNYRVITPEFALLNSHGKSDTYGLDLTYPLLRSRLRNLYLTFNHDRKSFHNEASLAVQSDYGVRLNTLTLAGNLFDSLGGGGANTASLAWSSGKLDQGVLQSGENPALAGRFSKLRYSAGRQQVLSETLSLYAAWSGQHGQRELDSSEKFFLGGSSGVRAYPSAEASGSSGQLASLELRARLPADLVLTGFYDWGHVGSFNAAPSYSLRGSGFSIAWTTRFGVNLKLALARRIGDNPNPTRTGLDQDGSLIRNRIWLNASLPF